MALKLFGAKEKAPYFDNIELARKMSADGMVLLKNDGVLPLKVGKIALFGAGAVDTIFCGTFSNYVNNPDKVNVAEGLKNGGFTFSTEVWLEKMQKATIKAAKDITGIPAGVRTIAGVVKHAPEVPISEADLAESRLGTETCIYVLRRETVQNRDRAYAPGDFLLSEVEQENLKKITASFKNVILVLNSGIIELGNWARSKAISGIILMGIPGMEAGNSLCDILTGTVNPSGRLTDTWAKKYKDYPACTSFSKKNRDSEEIDYKEGIFVGYRYFDTFDVSPLYPFGYGLSYTKFSYEMTYFEANWFNIVIKVKVKNIGKVSGRNVVQIYCSAPSNGLEKPYQQLIAFRKTEELQPGQSVEERIMVPTKSLASFNEKKSAWVMDRGEYIIRIGGNSRDTMATAKIVLNRQTVTRSVANVIAPEHDLDYIPVPERERENIKTIYTAKLNGDDFSGHTKPVKNMDEVVTYVQEGSNYRSYVNENKCEILFRCKERIEYLKPISSHTFLDVVTGRAKMEDFVASLSPEVLARICCGSYEETLKETESRLAIKFKPRKKVDFAGKVTGQFKSTLGIPDVNFIDGPAGIHAPNVDATCYPSASTIASTWDVDLIEEFGKAYGREMKYYGVDFCLAPALNIHRDPMAGRAFEYYSEDPLVTGSCGAAFVKGVQSIPGCGAVVKHFAVYNIERDNMVINCNVTRRALREIYLKGFEICIMTSHPKGVMNSRNKINGVHSSSRRALNMDILRAEWKFNGLVLSEWGTDSQKAYDIHAGCDLIMPGFNPDKILHAMMNVRTEFEEDGYVKETVRKNSFGRPLIVYDSWGSFEPAANGKDVIVSHVDKGVELNPRIAELEKEGICTVLTNEDGSKAVSYKGFHRGAFLALGDLQLAVFHILSAISDTVTMKDMLEQAK